ncbi:Lrp/AsnC family transcriptional regulator [Flavobacterium supellecticarium]|uniref:Lrp/AsnC family transcriptional regulator n=1 Tax=Flavobacterium supellecticarium TaxID=2565924 RepID=A0A4S4A3W4_9FLAO|nr:Lrp/AsnC family transcriptional regulator [Flavobacterium supellecticarium]THF53127.1 Lrp/AsnC family transcriptional regulator [Flavobacterium supellecticarium]
MENLDKFDLAILKVLQKDNLTPQRTIGESIGLSAAAVQRRIKRMRETGVISADITVINREKVGRMITLFVEVKMDSEKIELIDQAKNSFRSAPEVQQCYYVTGETDFVLVIVTPSMYDYEQLTRRLFFSNKNIKSFRTIVTLDIVKEGLEIPLDFIM